MPPPTHSIAAVPMTDSAASSLGTTWTRPRPSARGPRVAALGEVQADVVELHDQRDDAIDGDGDRDPDRGQRRGLHRRC